MVAFLHGYNVLFLEACCKTLLLDVNECRWDESQCHSRRAGSWEEASWDIDGFWRLVHLSDMDMLPENELVLRTISSSPHDRNCYTYSTSSVNWSGMMP